MRHLYRVLSDNRRGESFERDFLCSLLQDAIGISIVVLQSIELCDLIDFQCKFLSFRNQEGIFRNNRELDGLALVVFV